MALKTCTRPAGSVGAYARIEIRLSQDTIITSGGLNYLASPIEVTAAADGSYTVQLQANADLTPTGTYYTVSEFAGTTDQTYYIQVPSSAGPFVITTIQVSPLPTVAATPNHVSTLTVDGGAGSPTITNGDIAARSLTVASGSGPYTAAPGIGAGWSLFGGEPWIDLQETATPATVITDAAITGGQAILTSPSNALAGAVAGQAVGVVGAGAAGATLVTTILSVQSAGQVTLNANAGTGVSGATAAFGMDCTSAIQAWFNKIPTGGAVGTGIKLRAGVGPFIVTSTVTLPKAYHVTIEGTALRATQILMLTDNTPILKTADETIHSWTWDGIAVGYLAKQGAANTNAYGLMFSIPRPGVANGWYHWYFKRMYFSNCYVGMGYDPAGTGKYGLWDSTADVLWFQATQHSAVLFISPTPVAAPTNHWRSVKILNTGNSVTADGYALDMYNTEMRIDSLDIEDWSNGHLCRFDGNYPVKVGSCHFERIGFPTANDNMISIGPTSGTWMDARFTEVMLESASPNLNIGGGNWLYLFQVGDTASFRLDGFMDDFTAPPVSGGWQLVKSAGGKVYLSQIQDRSGAIGNSGGLPAPGSDTTTLNAIVQYDNQFFNQEVVFPGLWLPTGYLAETLDRTVAPLANAAGNLASGQIRVQALRRVLPKQITNVGFWSFTTGLTRGSNADSHLWFGICDSSFKVVAISADDTAGAWAATSAKQLALGTAFTPVANTKYYIFLMVNIGTGGAPALPTLATVATHASLQSASPRLSFNDTTTGQTTPVAVNTVLVPAGAQPSTLIYGFVN